MAGAMKNVSQSQLIIEILERSVAQTWDEARREWSLYEIYEADEPDMPVWSFPYHRALRPA